MHWGMPSNFGYPLINCRFEEAQGKNTFKSMIKNSRCAVPIDGYYEWMSKAVSSKKKTKIPYFIRRKPHGKNFPMLWVAGIFVRQDDKS